MAVLGIKLQPASQAVAETSHSLAVHSLILRLRWRPTEEE